MTAGPWTSPFDACRRWLLSIDGTKSSVRRKEARCSIPGGRALRPSDGAPTTMETIMGYSADENMVRVDFFRESGKWYCSEAVKWTGEWTGKSSILDEFARSLIQHLRDGGIRLSEMTAVCLEPYHEHSHPLMMTVKRAVSIVDGTELKVSSDRGSHVMSTKIEVKKGDVWQSKSGRRARVLVVLASSVDVELLATKTRTNILTMGFVESRTLIERDGKLVSS